MGLTLGASAFRRIRDAVRRVEQSPHGGAQAPRVLANPIELHVGKITSATTTDGRYPGLRWQRTIGASTPTYTATTEVIWIEPTNSETLAVGTLYNLKLADVHSDGKVVYRAVGASGSTASYARIATGSSTTINLGTTIAFATEVSDTEGYWDSGSPNIFTVPAGAYDFTANLTVNGLHDNMAVFRIQGVSSGIVALTSLAWHNITGGNYNLECSLSSGPVAVSGSDTFSVTGTVGTFATTIVVQSGVFAVKRVN